MLIAGCLATTAISEEEKRNEASDVQFIPVPLLELIVNPEPYSGHGIKTVGFFREWGKNGPCYLVSQRDPDIVLDALSRIHLRWNRLEDEATVEELNGRVVAISGRFTASGKAGESPGRFFLTRVIHVTDLITLDEGTEEETEACDDRGVEKTKQATK
jgi:hypothetical protein